VPQRDDVTLAADTEQLTASVARFLNELGCRPMPDAAAAGEHYDVWWRHAHARAGRPEITAADRRALNADRDRYVETCVRWYRAAPADARLQGDEIATTIQRLRTDPHYRRDYRQSLRNSRRRLLLSNAPQRRRICIDGRVARPRGSGRPRARRRAGATSRTASTDPGEPEPAGDHHVLVGWRTTAERPA